jgi:DNA polymerase elongation subunit (family B)
MPDISNLTDEDLLDLQRKLESDIVKYHNFQLVRKIQLNSAYGAIGNPYFRFYNTSMAEAITISGQMTIQWIAARLNEFLNKIAKTKDVDYIIASDTDSLYITVSSIVKKYAHNKEIKELVQYINDMSVEVIEPFLKKSLENLTKDLNADQNRIVMGREVIADRGAWTAKKRYMLNVWDTEGVRHEEPKQKTVGLETNRSSTPEMVRKELKKCIQIILNGNESHLRKEMKRFKKEFMEANVDDIAFPRSANNLEEYFDPNAIYTARTPINVKAALRYNYYITKMGLDKKYEKIQEGENIKFLFLKQPNPLMGVCGKDSVIGYLNILPKEFEIDKYIDREKQYTKSFLDPIQAIVSSIGWNISETKNLEELFL